MVLDMKVTSQTICAVVKERLTMLTVIHTLETGFAIGSRDKALTGMQME